MIQIRNKIKKVLSEKDIVWEDMFSSEWVEVSLIVECKGIEKEKTVQLPKCIWEGIRNRGYYFD